MDGKWGNELNDKDAEPEILHWDFGRDVDQTVKSQIKLLLSYIEKSVKNTEERQNRYLLPLKYLFCYAENSRLQDIVEKLYFWKRKRFTGKLMSGM